MAKAEMTVHLTDTDEFRALVAENDRLRAELGRFARADGYIVTGPNGVIEGFEVYVRLPQEEPTDGV